MAFKINIDSIIKLPLLKKVIILAAINIVILGAVYWFLTGPKYEEINRLNVELQTLAEKLNENRVIAADIPRYLREKEEMEAKLEKAVAQLPNEKEIPDLIDGISDAGKKAGLKILLFKPGREISKGFYADIPVNMSVEGRYESLYDFSVKVGSLPRIVNLSGMNITSAKDSGRVPLIKASFVATTFRFIPIPEGEEGK
jgi:type IV pilus assembly protein PilO